MHPVAVWGLRLLSGWYSLRELIYAKWCSSSEYNTDSDLPALASAVGNVIVPANAGQYAFLVVPVQPHGPPHNKHHPSFRLMTTLRN